MAIDWTPSVTLINTVENANPVSIFPNPTKGFINLNFSGNQSSASVIVENLLGASVYRNKIESGFSGLLNIDLSSFANGLYFVKIVESDKQFIYKVILNK